MAFAETISFDHESVEPKELWNWVRNMCQQCPYDSSEGQCSQQAIEVAEIKFTNQDKFD